MCIRDRDEAKTTALDQQKHKERMKAMYRVQGQREAKRAKT